MFLGLKGAPQPDGSIPHSFPNSCWPESPLEFSGVKTAAGEEDETAGLPSGKEEDGAGGCFRPEKLRLP